jgi:hypothetical protein
MPQTFSDETDIYSVDMMFAYLKNYNHPVSAINVDEYADALDYPGWGDPGNKIYYSASDVIKNKNMYPDEYARILKADLSYPIIISEKGFIVDGVHRLTKAYFENIPVIKAYIFNNELMNKFKIAEKRPGVWQYVDDLPVYELISLYYERFCNI